MSRRIRRVPYQLDAKNIKNLPQTDLVAILRGADELIMKGGRSLLRTWAEVDYRKVRKRIAKVIVRLTARSPQ